MRALATAFLLSLAMLTVAGARAQPSLPDPCAVPQHVKNILTDMRAVGGIEYLPSALLCRQSAYSATASFDFRGGGVRAALDRLVAFDPRYRWEYQNGVLVLRPADAWGNPDDFLETRLPSFAVEETTFMGAISALATPMAGFKLSGEVGPNPTEQDARRFSLSLKDTTIIAALNAIVRRHGALTWEVNYCNPSARYEYAHFSFRTFDNGGGGIHTAILDEHGKMRDACFSR
jgi:hypothetical protein